MSDENTLSSPPRPQIVEFFREHSTALIGLLLILLCLSLASHGFSKIGWGKAKEITDVLLNLLQMLALIVGGSWAYHKYAKGRTFHERVNLKLNGKLNQVGEQVFLVVHIEVRNAGQSVIIFAPAFSSLILYGYVGTRSTTIVSVQDVPLAQLPVFTRANLSLEPNGVLEETRLIFLPDNVELALRLECEIVSANNRDVWYTSSLVENPGSDIYHRTN